MEKGTRHRDLPIKSVVKKEEEMSKNMGKKKIKPTEELL